MCWGHPGPLTFAVDRLLRRVSLHPWGLPCGSYVKGQGLYVEESFVSLSFCAQGGLGQNQLKRIHSDLPFHGQVGKCLSSTQWQAHREIFYGINLIFEVGGTAV